LSFILADSKAIINLACSAPEVHWQYFQLWG